MAEKTKLRLVVAYEQKLVSLCMHAFVFVREREREDRESERGERERERERGRGTRKRESSLTRCLLIVHYP